MGAIMLSMELYSVFTVVVVCGFVVVVVGGLVVVVVGRLVVVVVDRFVVVVVGRFVVVVVGGFVVVVIGRGGGVVFSGRTRRQTRSHSEGSISSHCKPSAVSKAVVPGDFFAITVPSRRIRDANTNRAIIVDDSLTA